MPKVSVVTGYYNRGDYLESTICSILNQSFTDFELLVFDDASPDGTGRRLLELAEKFDDPRLRPLLYETNKGFTQGMIDAIAQSSGEYIAVQGSGDVSLGARLARQAEYLDTHPDAGVVGCWYTNVFAETGARRPRQPDANNVGFDALLKRNVFSHGEVMIRRSAYEKAGGYRAAFRNCQDYDLWLRIARIARLATVPEYLYDRYIRMDGVSYNPKKFAMQARYFLLTQRIAAAPPKQAEAMVKTLAKDGPLPLVPHEDKALQKRYLWAAMRLILWGAYNEAEVLARTSIINSTKRLSVIMTARFLDTPVGYAFSRIFQKFVGVG